MNVDWRPDDVAWAWLSACVVPDGPDDTAAQAQNNYVRAAWTGQPVDGKTAREWLDESNGCPRRNTAHQIPRANDCGNPPSDLTLHHLIRHEEPAR